MADPLLLELYEESGSHFIQRYRIEDLRRSNLSPYAQGTAFTSVDRLNAFTLLVGVSAHDRPDL